MMNVMVLETNTSGNDDLYSQENILKNEHFILRNGEILS